VGTSAGVAPAACLIQDAGASKGRVPTLERGDDEERPSAYPLSS